MEALRGGFLFVVLLIVVGFVFVKGDQLFGRNEHQKYTLPAAVVVGFTEENGGDKIIYRGKDGQTVLDLLAMVAEVQVFESNPDWVASINGKEVSGTQLWVYSVDGERQTELPGLYQTTNGQEIIWELLGEKRRGLF